MMSVEFHFNGIMYKQINGDSMGSPLGHILANIFVGFDEESLLLGFNKSEVYFCYVDDTFFLFSKNEVDLFFLYIP